MAIPAPWPAGPAGPDQTTQLPDPPSGPPALDVSEVGRSGPSRWPAVVEVIASYAPIGMAATWARVRAWCTVHPKAADLEDLRTSMRAGGQVAQDRIDEVAHEQLWDLRRRKVGVAAGVVLAGWAGWALLGAHGMWPLVIGSVVLPGYYTLKGFVLVRTGHAALGGSVPCGPPPLVRPRRLDGSEDPTVVLDGCLADCPEGGPGPVRGLFRRVIPGCHGPDHERTEPPVRTAPDPGPCPLTQDRVERALKAAKPKLKQIERERAKGDDDVDPVVQVLSSKHMGNGWAVTVGMPEEISAADMADARSGIANAFSTLRRGVPESCVILLPDPGNPRLLTLWICDSPPLEGPPVRTAMWHTERVDVHQGIPFGRTIEGDAVTVSPLSHWLIAGGTGSGKSESGGLLPLGCSLDPGVQQILMDPEGLGAWAAYSEVAEVIHGTGAAKLAEMADKLEWVIDHEFPRREAAIAKYLERGSMVMAKPKVTPRMAQDPTAGLPWMVISIDEAQALYRAKDSDVARRAEEAAVQIITRGRKYGIFLHQTTQKPTSDNIPTSISAIANTRLLFSVERTEMADAAMPGWRKLGMDPLALLPDDGRGGGNPGAGYLKGIGLVEPHRKWVLLRAECADLGEVREILKRAHAMRLEVRPELLPSAPKRPSGPTLTKEPTETAPLDLEPLRRVVAILAEHGGWVRASVVIGELSTRHPAEHGAMTTQAELNDLLRPYQLRTRQHELPDGGGRPHQVHYPTCAARLQALEHPSEQS